MSKRYLVTGGAGFIGSALVRRLVQNNHIVRVLDDLSRADTARLADVNDCIEFIKGDIRDAGTVRNAMTNVDAVVHAAFVNGTEFFYEKPELVLDVGVRGMLNVIDACCETPVGELFLASSSEVYQHAPAVPTDETVPLAIPDPLNPRYSYAAGKIISELLAINYGRRHIPRVVVFRPHNVYGPDMGWEHVIPQLTVRLARLIHTGNSDPIALPIQGNGSETRAFIYIDDFTDALMRVLDQGEHLGIYHIGTEDEISIRALAETLGKTMGREVRVQPGAPVAGGPARRCPDISRLRGLGFGPRTPLASGLARTVSWYRENLSLAPDTITMRVRQ